MPTCSSSQTRYFRSTRKMTYMADFTDTCIKCGRKFTMDDGTNEFSDRLEIGWEAVVVVCCDEESEVLNGWPTGRSRNGLCNHCCPDHGAVSDPTHNPELCGICTNDGERD